LVARAPVTFLSEETEWTSFRPLLAGMVVVDLLFAIVFFVMAMVVSLVSVKFDFCLHTPCCSQRAKPCSPVEILPPTSFQSFTRISEICTVRVVPWQVKNKPTIG
jgi:hypothetical protein